MIDFKVYFQFHHSLCVLYRVDSINQNSGYSERIERYSEPIYPSVAVPILHQAIPSISIACSIITQELHQYFHQTTLDFFIVPESKR